MTLANRATAILKVLVIVLMVPAIGSLAFGIYLYRLSLTLPDLRVNPDAVKTARTSVVFAADGSVIADWHGEQDRTVVGLKTMPRYLRDAVVAIEDPEFYHRDGRTLGSDRAGSPIAQQLVKILYTGGDSKVVAKIKQVLLALELTAKADDNGVLEVYLNTVYFGRGAYGVEAAAQRYFGKPAKALSLPESAALAGMIRSPSRYGRASATDVTTKRRDAVIDAMRAQGYISTEQAQAAKLAPLDFVAPKEAGSVAPYFVEYVKQDLIDRLGAERVYGGGLRVYTSLEPAMQSLAEKASHQLPLATDPEVALVAVRHADGKVLAMVGGRDFRADQFNLASQGRRQPGSAFKTFVLATALKQGISPDQVFPAAPIAVPVKDGVWNVQNYENEFTAGSMSLRAATEYSVNGVYARLIMGIGPDKVVQTAKKMGITTPLDADPAIALGGLKTGVSPLEMASAYGTIANLGLAVPPTGIVKVTDDRGRVLYEPEPTASRALDPAVADKTAGVLHDVIEHGTAQGARIGTWAAGKTGTTQSYRDAWFVGWSGDISTAVWVGNRKAQVPMLNVHGIKVAGGSYPATIWQQFMRDATKVRKEPPAPGSEPSSSGAPGEVLVKICADSVLLANPRCPRTVEIYLDPSLVPKSTCALH